METMHQVNSYQVSRWDRVKLAWRLLTGSHFVAAVFAPNKMVTYADCYIWQQVLAIHKLAQQVQEEAEATAAVEELKKLL